MSAASELFWLGEAGHSAGRWVLARPGASRRRGAVSTAALEQRGVDRALVRQVTAELMGRMEVSGAQLRTPGGVGWLDVHHVPVRRLVAQVVRKLLQLGTHPAFAAVPGAVRPVAGEALVTTRRGSAREYRYYTVTWSAVAYLLGGSLHRNHVYDVGLSRSDAIVPVSGPAQERAAGPAEVVGVSWSSRHAATLVPVLAEVRRRGHSTVLLDLATDPGQQVRAEAAGRVAAVPGWRLRVPGGPDACPEAPTAWGRVATVAGVQVSLERLEFLASLVVGLSAGCTQPSWRASGEVEGWLEQQLAAAQPSAVVVASDINPLGVLAIRAAERAGVAAFNVQHGAWLPGSVSRPALLARYQVVMGERDAVLARQWVERPDAEVHVLGQPRFDSLSGADREGQRAYLLELLLRAGWFGVRRVLVFAAQPVSPGRLREQIQVLASGVRAAGGGWGLVVAPHPAQDADLVELAAAAGGVPLAVADAEIGARGCLAGADAVATLASTCGLEAVLLNIPVLELALPGAETLALAEQGAATACATAQQVTAALNAVEGGSGGPGREAREAVCRWSGTSAADIAELIIDRATPGAATTAPGECSPHARAAEGVRPL
ncbi:hypothetical protein ABUW04_32070 [Streptacidiphilus sp. N1-10]|uniref:Uncharacterized protein n=1 Tax=Streptacidiphilus jeojiensis TaxID=3229225 RepID=A0ABV6XXC9_9ACTN